MTGGELTVADVGFLPESTTTFDLAQAVRVAATLDAPVPAEGDRLPPLWHWAWFTPTVPTAQLGPDGHPRPSSPRLAAYPRRMWGAGSVTWHGDLLVGQPATRTTSIASVKETSGGSGALLIVGVAHTYLQAGATVATETQTLVYRSQGAPVARPEGDVAVEAPAGGWTERRVPTEPLLQRFSAITFNAHRIHYDLPYAQGEEGYPGLVVHGPLTSLNLAGFVERSTGRQLASWTFKATAPLFAGMPVTYRAEPDGDDPSKVTASAIRNDGAAAMACSAVLR